MAQKHPMDCFRGVLATPEPWMETFVGAFDFTKLPDDFRFWLLSILNPASQTAAVMNAFVPMWPGDYELFEQDEETGCVKRGLPPKPGEPGGDYDWDEYESMLDAGPNYPQFRTVEQPFLEGQHVPGMIEEEVLFTLCDEDEEHFVQYEHDASYWEKAPWTGAPIYGIRTMMALLQFLGNKLMQLSSMKYLDTTHAYT